MLEDFRLQVFEAVVQTGSFTKAALLLDISQPAVSQNIAELEKVTGYSLFDRSYGKVELTSEGRIFKSYADKILMWYRAAGETFHKDKSRPETIYIGVSDDISAHLASILMTNLSSMYPRLNYEVGACAENNDLNIQLTDTLGPDTFNVMPAVVCPSSAISTLGQVTSLNSLLEKAVQISVWTYYFDSLPLELQSSVCLKSVSASVLKSFVQTQPDTICILPSIFVKDELANRSMIMMNLPLNIVKMGLELLPSPEFISSALWQLIRSSLG